MCLCELHGGDSFCVNCRVETVCLCELHGGDSVFV